MWHYTQPNIERAGYQYVVDVNWAHDGRGFIVGFQRWSPDKKQQESLWESGHNVTDVASVTDGEIHAIGVGWGASVSPASDDVAITTFKKLLIASTRGEQRVVTGAPRYPTHFPMFSGDLTGPLVWSPDGQRIFFKNIVCDCVQSDIYLVDAKSGKRRRFLENTTITIYAWR